MTISFTTSSVPIEHFCANHFLFDVHSIYTVFYSSDWRIWRQQISETIYGINIIIVLVWTYLQWKYATREHHLVDSDLHPKLTAIMSRRLIAGMILYAFAIAVSFLNTQVSLILFILIPIYYLIPQSIFGFGLVKTSNVRAMNYSSHRQLARQLNRFIIVRADLLCSVIRFAKRLPSMF
jgi:hypothetical protein